MAPPRKPLGIRRGTGGVAEEPPPPKKRQPIAVIPPDQQDRRAAAKAPSPKAAPISVTPPDQQDRQAVARKPPVPVLQKHGFHGDVDEFAQRLNAISTEHELHFGFKPSPGFAFDIARSKVPTERFSELLGVPKSKRVPVADWAREDMTPLTQKEAEEGLRRGGFLSGVRDALGDTASVAKTAGRFAIEAETEWAKRVGRAVLEDPTTLAGPVGLSQSRPMQEVVVGTELTKLSRGEQIDPKWTVLEAALLPIRGGSIARRIVGLSRRAKQAKEVVALPEEAAEAKVRESLGPARTGRAAQEALYREERGRRLGEAQAAQRAAGGGVEGFRAAKAELRGELPKVKFQHLREGNLSQEQFDGLFRTVQGHPKLDTWEKLHAQQGLLDAFEQGRVPQRSQINLLQTVFGEDAVAEVVRISKARKAGEFALDTLQAPRSLMSSFDFSAPFRQGLVAAAGHPRIFAKNFVPMLRAARSEKVYQGIMDEIASRPNAEVYRQSGLQLTDLGKLSTREEQFASNIAEKLPPVKVSARAYVAFLNKMRADVFDDLIDTARAEGINVENRKFLRGIAKYVNSATGRGSLGRIDDWAPALNVLFFSPRLIASRINFLDPTWYMRLDPFARKQALRSMLRLSGAAGVVLGLGAYGGAKVGLDPRNADFAKLRIGNTRIDVLGGFQQYIRLFSQIATGQIVSSSTGEIMTLGPGFGELSRKDILERFLVSKFAPPPSFVYDFFKGTDFAGEPFEVKKALMRRLIPFIAQDVYELYHETGNIPAAVGGAALAGFGFTVQTYSNTGPAEKIKSKYGKEGEKLLEAARVTGMVGKDASLPPQVTKALKTRTARYLNRAEMGADDTYSRFEADVVFLRKSGVIPESEARKMLNWAKREKRDYIIENKLDSHFDDLYGDALSEWNDDVKEVAGFERDVLQLRLDTLAATGVISRQTLPKNQKALYALGRKYLAFQKEAARKLHEAYEAGDEVDRDKLFADYRVWEEEQDQPVKQGGVTLPSFVRIAWGDSSPEERKKGLARSVTQRWQTLSSFDKELLGKKAEFSDAWLLYENSLGVYQNTASAESAKTTKEQRLAVAKQVNRTFPGFIKDWNFAQQPLAKRLRELKVVTKSKNKTDWLWLLGNADALIRASNPDPGYVGISKTEAKERWRRWIGSKEKPGIRAWIAANWSSFDEELRRYEAEDPQFVRNFLDG
jgi:hypothetical protein